MKIKTHLIIIAVLIIPMLLLCSREDENHPSHTSLTLITSDFDDFSFADIDVGYLYWNENAGHFVDVYVKRTIDRGRNWNLIYWDSRSGNLCGIVSISPDTCLVLSNYTGIPGLYSTFNGGTDWTVQPPLNGTSYASFIRNFSLDEKKNLIVAIAGDDGYDQNKLIRIMDDSTEVLFEPDTMDFRYVQISFPTVQDGYIIINFPISSRLLYYTHDSGKNWNSYRSPKDTWANDMNFISRDIGYVACDSGYLFKTIDGGMNWTKLLTNTTNDLNYLQFLDDNNGYCVGDSGTILITHDGINWHSWETEITQDIVKIQMLDTINGYLATSSFLYKIER